MHGAIRIVWRIRWSVLTLGMACLTAAGMGLAHAQTAAPKTAPAGDPALSCGQTPNGRAYWMEYGFCDVAVRGPAGARGVVFWSHGLKGDEEQYRFAPPVIIRRLANAGWDVIKVNRNNLYERGWTSSGVRHRDNLLERVAWARSQGYRAVLLAGQSYGGAISLEANAQATGIDGVLALSPGHGSDAGRAGSGGGGNYYNLDGYLVNAVAAQKGGRVVVLVAADDRYSPNRNSPGSYIGPRLRQVLGATGRPFVLFDETGPVHGHGAGETTQFATWFGSCVVGFLDPGQAARAGETVCPPPNPVPPFLLPRDLQLPVRGVDGRARWLGAWTGSYTEERRDLMIVVERIDGAEASIVYATGAGPQRDLSMGFERYKARIDGNRLTADRGAGRTLEVAFSADASRAEVVHKSPQGTTTGTLSLGSQGMPAASGR
ncbi:MAG: hypothetical protein U1E23_03625 [Reyranellaceae bacterium]